MPTLSRSAALRTSLLGLIAIAVLPAAPALAGPQSWGRGWGDEWGRESGHEWDRRPSVFDRAGSRISDRDRERDNEGEVEVTRFVVEGDAASALGQGPVTVLVLADDTQPRPGAGAYDYSEPGDAEPGYGPPSPAAVPATPADGRESATFEAAVIDQLVKAGYDTQPHPEGSGQVVELRIARGVAQSAELPRKPVSGEMAVGVSNRGSMVGMGINIDLTKPKKAMLSTRLEARILDAATGTVLWEGRADIATRDGSSEWTGQAVAIRLSEALFEDFPGRNGESFTRR